MNTIEVQRYRAKPGSHLPTSDADLIGSELERLSGAEGTTASEVVDAARPEDAPLHRFFEWDDAIAAEHWREHHARNLLNSIEVVVVPANDKEEETVRAFHVVPVEVEGKTQGRYFPLDVVIGTEGMAEKVIRRARGELRAFRRKYSAYQQYIRRDEALAKAFDAIHDIDED